MEGHGDQRRDPMSAQSHIRSFPGGIIRKVMAILEGIPCPFVPRRNHTEGHGDPRRDPMSVRSQEESHGRSRQSQKGSHVRPIPGPSAHDSSHADF